MLYPSSTIAPKFSVIQICIVNHFSDGHDSASAIQMALNQHIQCLKVGCRPAIEFLEILDASRMAPDCRVEACEAI